MGNAMVRPSPAPEAKAPPVLVTAVEAKGIGTVSERAAEVHSVLQDLLLTPLLAVVLDFAREWLPTGELVPASGSTFDPSHLARVGRFLFVSDVHVLVYALDAAPALPFVRTLADPAVRDSRSQPFTPGPMTLVLNGSVLIVAGFHAQRMACVDLARDPAWHWAPGRTLPLVPLCVTWPWRTVCC
jgi:hypothetical protein